MHPTLHPSSLPQIGDRVQVKQGVYARRVFIVIGAYSDQVELGDENGNFVYSCSPTIVTVCSSPATQTAPASLPAPADAGQGVGSAFPKLGYLFCTHCDWSGYSDELEADLSIGYQGGLCPECFSHCEEQA